MATVKKAAPKKAAATKKPAATKKVAATTVKNNLPAAAAGTPQPETTVRDIKRGDKVQLSVYGNTYPATVRNVHANGVLDIDVYLSNRPIAYDGITANPKEKYHYSHPVNS